MTILTQHPLVRFSLIVVGWLLVAGLLAAVVMMIRPYPVTTSTLPPLDLPKAYY